MPKLDFTGPNHLDLVINKIDYMSIVLTLGQIWSLSEGYLKEISQSILGVLIMASCFEPAFETLAFN